MRSIALATLLIGLVAAQTPGKLPEKHPKIQTWSCTKKHGCKKQNNFIVIDSSSHPIYQRENPSLGCGNWGSAPNATVCPDAESCQKNCIIEGIKDYSEYGVTTKGSSLTLRQVTDRGVVSPRVYLLDEKEKNYEMLKLTGKEFAFDVDASKLPCGMNGALYLSEMEADGGKSKLNKGGAYYGTGYCDAQCFTFPFVNGVGNIEGKGACCNELDIWEANARATHLAPHPCSKPGLYLCSGDECGFDGVCDEWGCGINPSTIGNKQYYGPGYTVDTKRPFTVVTQFPAEKGKLKEIHRFYIQDGKVIENASVNITGPPEINYMNDEYCAASGATKFGLLGAMTGMGEAMSRGMVLAMSIWWDEGGFMQWLDGGAAGPCNATEGDPKIIRQIQPDTSVEFSKIRWGEIGSTYNTKL